MLTHETWMRIDGAFPALVRKALEAAIIKAALDERKDDRAAYEGAMNVLKAAAIDGLPDRPRGADNKPLVRCWMTLEELTDLEHAMELYVKNLDNRAGYIALWAATRKRVVDLLARVRITITLNKTSAAVH